MRHRSRVVLTMLAIGAVVMAACDLEVDGSDDGNAESVVVPPDAREYCALVESYYEELGEFVDSVSREVGPESADDALDQRFVGFVREHQQLYEQLASAAPDEIEDAARVQQETWAMVAEDGNLQPLQTDAALAAEDETVEYEADVCGIIVG